MNTENCQGWGAEERGVTIGNFPKINKGAKSRNCKVRKAGEFRGDN